MLFRLAPEEAEAQAHWLKSQARPMLREMVAEALTLWLKYRAQLAPPLMPLLALKLVQGPSHRQVAKQVLSIHLMFGPGSRKSKTLKF